MGIAELPDRIEMVHSESDHPKTALLTQLRYWQDHPSTKYTVYVYSNMYPSIITTNYLELWLACMMLILHRNLNRIGGITK